MTTSTPGSGRLLLFAVSGILGLSVLAGCSSDSTTATESAAPSDTASAAYCSGVDQVTSSLEALVNTKIVQEGTATLKTRFDAFKADAGSLVDSASAAFATETAAVEASIATLENNVANLTDSPSAAGAASIQPALQGVATSTNALIDAVKGACPTS